MKLVTVDRMAPHGPGVARISALILLLLGLGAALSIRVNRPWTGHHDFNGACWSQAARNNLRAGLETTLGIPASSFFGQLPIPPKGYYVHNPPGVSLMVTISFALFGEREWAARIVPIVCTLASAMLLWCLVRSCLGERPALFSVLVFSLLPMELYFGRMVNYEPCAQMWMLAALLSLRYWHLTGKGIWFHAACLWLILGMLTAWQVYIFAAVIWGSFVARFRAPYLRASWAVLATGAFSLVLFLTLIRLVRPDAWEDLWRAFAYRTTLSRQGEWNFTWSQWFGKQRYFFSYLISPVAWGSGLVGAIHVAWGRTKSEGVGWVGWAALSFFLTATINVVVLKNASFMHDFWGFYFAVPVAMMAGVALDAVVGWRPSGKHTRALQVTARSIVVVSLLLLGVEAYRDTRGLHRVQDWIVHAEVPQAPDLIPSLGSTLCGIFPEDTRVVCDFPGRGPQLEYYARRDLIYTYDGNLRVGNNYITNADWKTLLSGGDPPLGAVVWLGAEGAQQVIEALPPGIQTKAEIGALEFLFWKSSAPAK